MLVAISIPIFTAQLEKSKEATDVANLRSAYASCAAAVLDTNGGVYAEVPLKQGKAGWDSNVGSDSIGGFALSGVSPSGTVGQIFYVVVNTDGTVSVSTSSPGTGYKKVNPINGSTSS